MSPSTEYSTQEPSSRAHYHTCNVVTMLADKTETFKYRESIDLNMPITLLVWLRSLLWCCSALPSSSLYSCWTTTTLKRRIHVLNLPLSLYVMLESHRHFSLTNPPHCASEATYAIRHHHILFNLILLLLPCHPTVFSSGIPSSLFTVDCYMILRPRMRNERSRPTLRHLRPAGRRSRKNGKSSWLAGWLPLQWCHFMEVHVLVRAFKVLVVHYASAAAVFLGRSSVGSGRSLLMRCWLGWLYSGWQGSNERTYGKSHMLGYIRYVMHCSLGWHTIMIIMQNGVVVLLLLLFILNLLLLVHHHHPPAPRADFMW